MRRVALVPAVLVPAAVIAALVVGAAPMTLARFTDAGEAAATFSTGSILPPTSVATSVSGGVVTLTWTPTTSSAATGYDVLRSSTSGSGYSVVGTVTPRTATTTTNSPGGGTWYYVLQSSLENWRSSNSNQALASIGTLTGYKACSTNAADTGGDNNGYQTSPANGCVTDTAIATDSNSGTNTVLSCTNTGKDRHRFGGYTFGLPGSVSSVDGIELRLVAGMSNNGGTTRICAQLSWDGGTTWTATKEVTLSGTALATYDLGGATDTWGRAWTKAQLASGTFVVRLINVASQSNKGFRLDGVSVQVRYTP
jgi:hypothetical protein